MIRGELQSQVVVTSDLWIDFFVFEVGIHMAESLGGGGGEKKTCEED